jgi:hypothetical protein
MEEQPVSAVEPVGAPVPATIAVPPESAVPSERAAPLEPAAPPGLPVSSGPPAPSSAPAPVGLAAAVPVRKFMGIALARAVPMVMYQMNRIGRNGMAGSALILFTAVFFFSAVLPQFQQIAALKSDILQAQPHAGAGTTPPVRLNKFLDSLPKRSDLPQIAAQIFGLAAVAGVTLERGRYELTPMHSGHLARYRMVFPIKGRYPAIRHFVDATLMAIPSAAVEGLRIERKSVGEDNVEVELGFSVFVRNI